jgi:hypothetical protein
MSKIIFQGSNKFLRINLNLQWTLISKERSYTTFTELKADFETHLPNFELFWYSKPLVTLRENGLLAV